jgi:hypothetical protein
MKIQNVLERKKIIAVLLIFLSVVACPYLYNAAYKKVACKAPDTRLHGGEEKCVGSREEMRIAHKELLGQWMTSVVRDGVRTFEAKDGRRYPISLGRTCMRCHRDKTTFCDHCHEYLAVSDNKCWDCHIS